MDLLPTIKKPIADEMESFVELFNLSLTHPDGLLSQALAYIRKRGGKRMRPMLIFLIAKAFGSVNDTCQNAAVGLELLHTASLVHDDVVDESSERRGQASVNAVFDNKVSVLVGDYILSTALLKISQTRNYNIVDTLASLGQTLSNGELLQLSNISNQDISEDVYYGIIMQKTAALFEACAAIGAMSVGCNEQILTRACQFGRDLGIAFQIRDDIFDYYEQGVIGKPTGNDMLEGKLTLPVIYALNSTDDKEMMRIALKVKNHDVEKSEIDRLVEFTKQNGGIEYAFQSMEKYKQSAICFVEEYIQKSDIKQALLAYVEYVAARNF